MTTPKNAIWTAGTGNDLSVNFGSDFPGADSDFTLDISAPGRRRLRNGRYRNATRVPFNGSRPGIGFSGSLSRMGGCLSTYGEFTIRSLRYVGVNHLKSIRLSFVARCGDQASQPIRGSFVFRR